MCSQDDAHFARVKGGANTTLRNTVQVPAPSLPPSTNDQTLFNWNRSERVTIVIENKKRVSFLPERRDEILRQPCIVTFVGNTYLDDLLK